MIVIDMDMPKSCGECSALHRPYSNIESTFCHLNPYEWIKVEDITKKPDFCPIKCDIEDIKHDIENQLFVGRLTNHYEFDEGLKWCLEIIDKHCGKEQE